MNLTPLAIALQGIGYGSFLTAVQGLAESGASWLIVLEGIPSAETFGRPTIRAISGSRRGFRPAVLEPLLPHRIVGAGAIQSAEAVGRPRIVPGPLSPWARRRRDEEELLLVA